MKIEVDQSGKIEQLNKDTYFAFGNSEEYRVKFSKKTKGEIPLLRVKDKNFDKNKIKFRVIGKCSRAHRVAKSAFVGKSKLNRIPSKENIIKWLR